MIDGCVFYIIILEMSRFFCMNFFYVDHKIFILESKALALGE